MSQEYHRKATFTMEVSKGEVIYHPVNKRAHTVAKKLGKRTRVPEELLKTAVGKGSYEFCTYVKGVLKPITF